MRQILTKLRVVEFFARNKRRKIIIFIAVIAIIVSSVVNASATINVPNFDYYNPPSRLTIHRFDFVDNNANVTNNPNHNPTWQSEFPYRAILFGARPLTGMPGIPQNHAYQFHVVYSRTPATNAFSFTVHPQKGHTGNARYGFIHMTFNAGHDQDSVRVGTINGFGITDNHDLALWTVSQGFSAYFDFWYECCSNLTVSGLASVPVPYNHILHCRAHGGPGGSQPPRPPGSDGDGNGGNDCCHPGCISCHPDGFDRCRDPLCPFCNPPCLGQCGGPGMPCGCASGPGGRPPGNIPPGQPCPNDPRPPGEDWANRPPWTPPPESGRPPWQPPMNEPPPRPEWQPPANSNEGQGSVGDTGETGTTWSLPGWGDPDVTGHPSNIREIEHGIEDWGQIAFPPGIAEYGYNEVEIPFDHGYVDFLEDFYFPQGPPFTIPNQDEWAFPRPPDNNEWIFPRPPENNAWVFWRP